jgi:hypothetical protein
VGLELKFYANEKRTLPNAWFSHYIEEDGHSVGSVFSGSIREESSVFSELLKKWKKVPPTAPKQKTKPSVVTHQITVIVFPPNDNLGPGETSPCKLYA